GAQSRAIAAAQRSHSLLHVPVLRRRDRRERSLAVPAISSDNAAIIRRPSSAIDPCYLCIYPLTVAGTALVNGAPDYDSPVYELAIDGASTDFEANTDRGAFVRITDPSTGAIKYEGTLRRPPTASLLSIEAIRDGDTGTAQLFGQSI